MDAIAAARAPSATSSVVYSTATNAQGQLVNVRLMPSSNGHAQVVEMQQQPQPMQPVRTAQLALQQLQTLCAQQPPMQAMQRGVAREPLMQPMQLQQAQLTLDYPNQTQRPMILPMPTKQPFMKLLQPTKNGMHPVQLESPTSMLTANSASSLPTDMSQIQSLHYHIDGSGEHT